MNGTCGCEVGVWIIHRIKIIHFSPTDLSCKRGVLIIHWEVGYIFIIMRSKKKQSKYINYFIHVTGAHYSTSGHCSKDAQILYGHTI